MHRLHPWRLRRLEDTALGEHGAGDERRQGAAHRRDAQQKLQLLADDLGSPAVRLDLHLSDLFDRRRNIPAMPDLSRVSAYQIDKRIAHSIYSPSGFYDHPKGLSESKSGHRAQFIVTAPYVNWEPTAAGAAELVAIRDHFCRFGLSLRAIPHCWYNHMTCGFVIWCRDNERASDAITRLADKFD